jgi:DNA-binding HxlR family transcriptional regulator
MSPTLLAHTLHLQEGTKKCYTYRKESDENMAKASQMTRNRAPKVEAIQACTSPQDLNPRVEDLVNDLIGRVADKWTMLVIEVLVEKGELRFTRLSELVVGISQKMLTQTLRQMERDGLITRTVHPVVPPKVEYKLTHLGMSLGAAFCGVWIWAEEHLDSVEKARSDFDEKAKAISAKETLASKSQ